MIGGSHSGDYEEFYPLGFNAVWSVESEPTTRRYIPEDSTLQLILLTIARL
jgi:hypothetical protein